MVRWIWVGPYAACIHWQKKGPDGFDDSPKLSLTSLGLCSDPDPANPSLSRDKLGATDYQDVYAGWNRPFGVETLKVSIGLNNAFAKQPPICLSCSLNGYDPGTCDLSGGSDICMPSIAFSKSLRTSRRTSADGCSFTTDATSGIRCYS